MFPTLACALMTAALHMTPPLSQEKYTPTDGYQAQSYRGFKLLVSKELEQKEADLCGRTLKLLHKQIDDIYRVIPNSKISLLQKSKIWVDFNSPGKSAMVYHPGKQWLIENGYNPDKENCVELSHPDKFLDWCKWQPYMLLHELAHGYHDQVLGFGNKEIAKAYEKAKASGRYDSIQHINGSKQKHYAMTNPQEFFAEMTEAYFGKNDLYPFDRQELRSYDPETFALIERL